jgi:hypothetical protein
MCGRYRRTTKEEELARQYNIPIPPQRDLPISWNIATCFRPSKGGRHARANESSEVRARRQSLDREHKQQIRAAKKTQKASKEVVPGRQKKSVTDTFVNH